MWKVTLNFRLKNAFDAIELMVWLNETEALKEYLNICNDVITDDEDDVASLFGNLVQIIQKKLRLHSYADIEQSCDTLTTGEGTDFERFSNWLKNFLYPRRTCFNVNAADMIERLNHTEWLSPGTAGGDRQLFYLQCSTLGHFETSDSPNHPFGNRFTYQRYLHLCDLVFGEG